MPKGYAFLRKGNPYLTALCRRKTHEAKKTLYVVVERSKPQGLRAPKWILGEVFAEERTTRLKRQNAVERRDDATKDTFAASIYSLFPKIPEEDIAKILKRALQKRSGRVGRTGKLDVDEKARLAVAAHVRHSHTDYDKILVRRPNDRAGARRAVHKQMLLVMAEWRGSENSGKLARAGKTKGKMATKGVTASSAESGKSRRRSLPVDTGKLATARESCVLPERTKSFKHPRLPTRQKKEPQSVTVDLTLDDSDSENGNADFVEKGSESSSEDEDVLTDEEDNDEGVEGADVEEEAVMSDDDEDSEEDYDEEEDSEFDMDSDWLSES